MEVLLIIGYDCASPGVNFLWVNAKEGQGVSMSSAKAGAED